MSRAADRGIFFNVINNIDVDTLISNVCRVIIPSVSSLTVASRSNSAKSSIW